MGSRPAKIRVSYSALFLWRLKGGLLASIRTVLSILISTAADCTIAALDAMLTVHPTGDVTAAETSLEAHIVATQTGAARGLDRIDQLGLLLNSQYTYDDAGPPAHTPRASGPFSRRSRAH